MKMPVNNYETFEIVNQLQEWINDKFSLLNAAIIDEARDRNRTIIEIIARFNKLNIPLSDDIIAEQANLEKILIAPKETKKELENLAKELLSLAKDIKNKLHGIRNSNNISGTRSPPQKLRISLPGGIVFHEKTATDTFVRTLHHIGLKQVSELTSIMISGYPLVSSQKNKFAKSLREVDGYFIELHSSTKSKAKFIERIASLLNMDISVEVLE